MSTPATEPTPAAPCPAWCDPAHCTAGVETVPVGDTLTTIQTGAHIGTPQQLLMLEGQQSVLSWSRWRHADDPEQLVMAEVRLSPGGTGVGESALLECDELPALAAALLEMHTALAQPPVRRIA